MDSNSKSKKSKMHQAVNKIIALVKLQKIHRAKQNLTRDYVGRARNTLSELNAENIDALRDWVKGVSAKNRAKGVTKDNTPIINLLRHNDLRRSPGYMYRGMSDGIVATNNVPNDKTQTNGQRRYWTPNKIEVGNVIPHPKVSSWTLNPRMASEWSSNVVFRTPISDKVKQLFIGIFPSTVDPGWKTANLPFHRMSPDKDNSTGKSEPFIQQAEIIVEPVNLEVIRVSKKILNHPQKRLPQPGRGRNIPNTGQRPTDKVGWHKEWERHIYPSQTKYVVNVIAKPRTIHSRNAPPRNRGRSRIRSFVPNTSGKECNKELGVGGR